MLAATPTDRRAVRLARTRHGRIHALGALADIDAALRAVEARAIPWHAMAAAEFPLRGMRALLDDVAAELEDGCGMVKLTGLPVQRYDDNQLRLIWFGLGCHLGRPVYQNSRGELMREIRDEGAEVGARYGELRGEGSGIFLSSYARTLTNGRLRFHTDRTDAVGLLCVRQARAGGTSRLASSAAIHNEMLRRRPDLLELLFQAYPRSRFGEEAGGPDQVYGLPIFGLTQGKFTSHYSLTFIEAAQKVAGVPRLTTAQREAIDQLMALAEELSFEMTLEPGDIQFLNNHVIYHGRTAFADDDASGQRRLLLRLWLSMPNSRPLPADHAVLWRDVRPGALRGGIEQVAELAD